MPGALNTLLREGPPPTPPGGAGQQPIPVKPVIPQPGPPPAAPTSAPAGSPLAGLLAQQQGQPQQKPAPNQQQTVAALMHLTAVQKEMEKLSNLPGIGKENIRPEIFDTTAELMGRGLFTLPQVMNEIKTIPSDPPGQRNWVMTHLRNVVLAQKQILADHAQAFPGTGDAQGEVAASAQPYDPDSHADLMKSLATHYSGRKR